MDHAEATERISSALEIARKYGSTDGEHHKSWVIDQMVGKLTGGIGTAEWNRFHHSVEDTGWDPGVAP